MTRARRRTLLGLAALWAGTWLVNRSLVAVRGPSMLPTLPPGERLLTLPVPPGRPSRGRVVVVEDPATPGHLVVKRVADLDATSVLVLGDNPPASTDGRVWGPLPTSSIRRIAVARWPGLSARGLR